MTKIRFPPAFLCSMEWSGPFPCWGSSAQSKDSVGRLGHSVRLCKRRVDLGAIKASLQGVTGGLATGFEITLIALIFALILQLSITFEQQRELSIS